MEDEVLICAFEAELFMRICYGHHFHMWTRVALTAFAEERQLY